jgi:hypothetical protein
MISLVSHHHHFQVMNMELADTEVMIIMLKNLQARKTQLSTHKV